MDHKYLLGQLPKYLLGILLTLAVTKKRVEYFLCTNFDHTSLLQDGEPLPGPKSGLLSNFPKWNVRGDTCANKARDFIEKGHLVEEQQVREPRRTALAHSLRLYDNGANFWVMSGRSSCLAHSLTQSPSWWHVRLSAKMGHEKESGKLLFSSLFWPVLSPPSYFAAAAPCSLPGSPAARQLRQAGLAKVGGFYQQFPNTAALHLPWFRQ